MTAEEAPMLRIFLVFSAALIAGSSLVTSAEAGGCHHGFDGGYFRQSYSSQSYANPAPNYYARRKAIAEARARAKAHAVEKARLLAARRSAAEKVEVAHESQPTQPVDAATPILKKADSEKSAALALNTAAAPQVCRKFSATVGGLIETACE